MTIILFEISQYLPHIIVVLTAHCETSNSIIIVILDNFISFGLVTQIVFIEDYEFFLLILFDDEIELWISTTIWYACISNFHEYVHFISVFLDQAQCLLHVSWKPIYMVLQMLYYLHSIDPTIIQSNNYHNYIQKYYVKIFTKPFCDLIIEITKRFIFDIINLLMSSIKLITLIIVSSLFLYSAFSWQYNNPYTLSTSYAVVKQDWIDQIIDHLNYNSDKTFKQRYYALDDYYLPGGPAYLYICGEAECKGISNTSWTAEIARRTNGIIFALEHRYYGKSLPFGNESMSFQNLKYLNSEQALSDLAYFISYIKAKQLYGVKKSNPWITVGGSYAGAMSAWFRSKYPHLTVGALGSSGVVLAVEDFKDFDEQIYQSALKSGTGCVQAIQDINAYVEDIINSDQRQAFQAQFNADKLTLKEFLFYWADVVVFQFQYSKRVEFCQSISGKTRQEVFNVIKKIALTVSPVDYGAYYLKNATFAIEDGRGARAWIYQSCTQFSYFQTFSDHPMRSLQLDLDFYKSWCADIFGAGVWPFVKRVNNEFGGVLLQATNLYMSNGDQDPWRWASLQKSRKNIISKVYVCPDCGHCVDLRGPTANDADTLKAVRAEQYANIQKWLAQNQQRQKIIAQ